MYKPLTDIQHQDRGFELTLSWIELLDLVQRYTKLISTFLQKIALNFDLNVSRSHGNKQLRQLMMTS